MKQRCAVLLMILTFGMVCFGQNEAKTPETIVREFWSAALKDDSKNLKRFLSAQFSSEKSFVAISENVGFIAANEINIMEFTRQQIFADSAFLELRATGKGGKKWEAQILLRSERRKWKILHLYLRSEVDVPLIFNHRRLFLPPNPQIRKDCPKCT